MHCRITIGENKTNQLASEFLGSHHCLQMALLKDYFHINSLPSKQPPQRQRFCEAGRMNQPVLVCGVDHPRRQSRALLHGLICGLGNGTRNGLLQRCPRGIKTTQPQTHCNHRQHRRRAQEYALRRPLQRPKPPQAFQHHRATLAAGRVRPAGLTIPPDFL